MNQDNKNSQPNDAKSGKPNKKPCFFTNLFKNYCKKDQKDDSSITANPNSQIPDKPKSKPCQFFKKIFKKRGKGKIFKLDEKVGEENLYTEFKNFSCAEIMKEQYKILTKLICGFLNTEGGKIYLGVDNSSCVKGKHACQFIVG